MNRALPEVQICRSDCSATLELHVDLHSNKKAEPKVISIT